MITGPNADSFTGLHGAWSYCWQGNRDSLYPSRLETIAQVFAETKANYIHSFSITDKTTWNKEALIQSAKQADVIMVFLGEPAYAETPGNTPDLDLPEEQVELVQALAKSGKQIVLVLLQGRPRVIRKIESYCNAILLAYWPGPQGARALH